MKLGLEGVGIYWSLVEIAYEQGGSIHTDNIESIAFDLRTQCERITDVLESYSLFYKSGDYYYSESINKRLSVRQDKSQKAQMSAKIRWEKRKNQDVNANALRTQSDGNAIKEKKRKEKNIIKEGGMGGEKLWRNDFETYLAECKEAYKRFYTDKKFIAEQERLNPNVNIKLSIEKGFVNFWGTEAGWKHKKKSRAVVIDWRSTIINSIDLNKVWINRKDQQQEPTKTLTGLNL